MKKKIQFYLINVIRKKMFEKDEICNMTSGQIGGGGRWY